jgi:adenylate cyclase
LQDEVTSRLARTLKLELIYAANRRVEQERRTDSDARDLTMRGWAASYRPTSRENSQVARGFFERALAIDGRSIGAMTGLAAVLAGDVLDGWSSSPDEDRARAEALIRQALDLNPNNADAHYTRGVLLRAQNRLDVALDAFRTVVAQNRNNAGVLSQMGIVLMFLGRPEEAIPLDEKALRLDPRNPNLAARLWALGYAHLLLGHVDEAIDLLRRARAANSRLFYVHIALAGALGLKGDLENARLEVAESIRLKPEFDTLKRMIAGVPWANNPKVAALREKTILAGLRRAGMSEE